MMNKRSLRSRFALSATCLIISMLVFSAAAIACTAIMVTPGASIDGTASVTHTCDSGNSPYELTKVPAANYAPGTMVDVLNLPQTTGGNQMRHYAGNPTGNMIPQVEHTYAYIKSAIFGIINEHQVAMGETTTSGRRESRNTAGFFDITNLSMIGLERGATAREAVEVMGRLSEVYGYKDGGEQLLVSDPYEVWLFEIVGPGPFWAQGDSEPGAYWVAQRVPDGHISACANNAVIDQIVFNDVANFMYGPGMLEFAMEMGWWSPASGKAFSWRTHMCNATSRTSYQRVWGVFRQVSPKLTATLDMTNLPFSIPVERKLSVEDINNLQRDHYEDTEFDGRFSLTAGPFNNPRRYRGLSFRVDGVSYTWQRMIAQVQCEYAITTQSRAWLPDEIGGVVWYGPANPDTTCFVPLYASMTELADCLTEVSAGSHQIFTKDSFWWSICAVTTFIDMKYSSMVVDVNKAIDKYERAAIKNQGAVEHAALQLYAQDPALAVAFLTKYANDNVNTVMKAWWELFDFLLWKYNIGHEIDTENLRVVSVGYPEAWLRKVLASNDGDLNR